MMKKKIGFLFADDLEFLPFSQYSLEHGGAELAQKPHAVVTLETDNAMVYAIHSGVGKVRATMAAMTLIREYQVEAVLNAGLSGAISSLHKGDVVAGTSYVECDFDVRVFGRKLGEKIEGDYIHQADAALLDAALQVQGMQQGALGTGDFFLHTADKKEEYKKEFGIAAFDMESAAIACVCDAYSVPFLSVRKISDDADDAAPETYQEMNALAEMALTEVLLEIVQKL